MQKGNTRCPVCDEGRYELLEAKQGSVTTVLCGQNAVQVSPRPAQLLDLAVLAERLSQVQDVGLVVFNEYLLQVEVEGLELSVFPDGRTIVKGTDDPACARAVCARYMGS
jgi:hypothetical protein